MACAQRALADPSPRRGIPGAASSLTQVLHRARGGDQEDLETLVATVYRELRRSARSMLGRERSNPTLGATELVHETFLRLFGGQHPHWEDRRHFFGSVALAMRRILIDLARKKRAGRRIPKDLMLPLEKASGVFGETRLDLVALDDALVELAARNPRQARVVELRFFAGLSESEVAGLLGVSHMTVHRDWKVARLRLLQSMES
ncbi:MAG: ECF-type sigma factor [Acidobacteriota bacterium]